MGSRPSTNQADYKKKARSYKRPLTDRVVEEYFVTKGKGSRQVEGQMKDTKQLSLGGVLVGGCYAILSTSQYFLQF